MYKEFEDALIKKLANVVTTKRYLGEIRDMNNPKISTSDLPIVYVDFVEDKPSAVIKHEVFFNLYIVHVVYSKNPTQRANANNNLFDLIENIDKTINSQSLANSSDINLLNLKKIFDASAAGGYITIYRRLISAELLGEIE